MKRLLPLFLILALAFLSACGGSGSSRGGGSGEDTGIPPVNNPARIDPDLVSHRLMLMYTANTNGVYEKYGGGIATRYRMFFKAREAAERSHDLLILDAGNTMYGTELSEEYKGLLDIDMLNRLGYSAATKGDNDFYRGGTEDAKETLAQTGDKLTYLAANAAYHDGSPMGERYKIYDYGEYRVGVFGIAGSSDNIITASDPVAAAQAVVADLAGRCDAVIALIHTDDITAEAISRIMGVDLVINGGSLANNRNDTAGAAPVFTVQDADYVGVIEFDMSAADIISAHRWESIINNASYPPEGLINGIIERYRLNFKIGWSENGLEYGKGNVRTQETRLGDLVTDAVFWYTQTYVNADIDFGYTNGGAIFNPLPPGDILRINAENVMRVPEDEYIVKMRGSELKRHIKHASQFHEGVWGVYSKELRIEFDREMNIVNLKINGADIDDGTDYIFNMNYYMYNGGDGYDTLNLQYTTVNSPCTLLIVSSCTVPAARMISKYIQEHPGVVDSVALDGRVKHAE
jgi:2',3'-cyclic-nucleotide 2'-phosphodiesterase (5'-nucleotidase family)